MMKNWIFGLFFSVLVSSTCFAKAPVENKVIGEWKLDRIELNDRSIATQEAINFVSSYKANDSRIIFDVEKRYRTFSNGKEHNKEDKIIFKIVDKSFKPSINGAFIDFDIYDADGGLYQGTNRPGPFEIVKITKSELILKNLELRFKAIRKGEDMTTNELNKEIIQNENILFVYYRNN